MRVLILGGTSGVGWALAQHYLHQGATVGVCGRDLSRLANEPQRTHPRLQLHALDVADRSRLAQLIEAFSHEGLDLLIVAAGVYFNTRHHRLDAATTMRLLQTNVSGLSHAFELAAQKMLTQQSGHLVAISSVAGLLKDYPGASLYSASKRSVLSLCDTYRIALKPFSIQVSAIVPGYMDTARLRALNGGNASHKPFLMSQADAVQRMVDAIERRQAVAVFPWPMRWLMAVLNLLPRAVWRWRSPANE